MQPKPKKSLGQNFLKDPNIQKKIITACNFNLSDIVLEIGAGSGIMTGAIAGRVKKVYAVEIDRNLLGTLKDNLGGCDNVTVINQDILKLNLKDYSFGKEKIKS